MAKSSPALPILVGGAAAMAMASKKKKKKRVVSHWGVRVTSSCDIEIVDSVMFDRFLIGAFFELIDIDSSLDVFQLTDAMYGEVAPDCSSFPEDPASPSAIDFYFLLLKFNSRGLLAKGLATKASLSTHERSPQFIEWYRYWRNPPSSEIPDVPKEQVGFASDFTDYIIGSKWYESTVKPFVAKKVAAGHGDVALADFARERAVAVGKTSVPISQLPEGPAVVGDFLGKLRAAVERAKSEA